MVLHTASHYCMTCGAEVYGGNFKSLCANCIIGSNDPSQDIAKVRRKPDPIESVEPPPVVSEEDRKDHS